MVVDVITPTGAIQTGAATTIANVVTTVKIGITEARTVERKVLAKKYVKQYAKQRVMRSMKEQQIRIVDALDHFLTHHIRY